MSSFPAAPIRSFGFGTVLAHSIDACSDPSLRDVSTIKDGESLTSVGTITDHTRPVQSLDARMLSSDSAELYTADTMGIIKTWEITKDGGDPPRWQSKLVCEFKHHRTGVNDMIHGNGHLWTGWFFVPCHCFPSPILLISIASTDETVHIIPHPALPPTPNAKPNAPIEHPTAVRAILPLSTTSLGEPYLLTGAGDVIRVYDVSNPAEPELLAETDGHWHDVTALRLWIRETAIEGEPGKVKVEPWIVSASLDGTIRRWRLEGKCLLMMSYVNTKS